MDAKLSLFRAWYIEKIILFFLCIDMVPNAVEMLPPNRFPV